MKTEISIIVPVYKVEKTLRKCLDSIIGQTFENWELIAVNDCSPDGSAKILAAYEKRDNRIKVVNHSVNRGVSRARFTGMAHASGKYVVFVDSDDWMSRRALRVMYDKIEAEGADMVTGAIVKVVGRLGIIRTKPRNTSTPINRNENISTPELFDNYFITYFGGNMLAPSVWGKIYRRTVIEKAAMKPVPFFYGEDLIFNLMLHPYLSKISFIDDTVYYYRVGGSTSTSTPYMLDAVKKQYRLKREYIEKYSYEKAVSYLNSDLIDHFFYHFRNLVMLDGMSPASVAELIAAELRNGFYDEELLRGVAPTPLVNAVSSRDVAGIIELIDEDVKKIGPRHRLVNAISKLI